MIKYEKRNQNRIEVALNSGFNNSQKVIVKTDLSSKDTIRQVNGVKMSSFAKKNRVRLCENIEQKILLQGGVNIDKKPNGFISRKKALKAK